MNARRTINYLVESGPSRPNLARAYLEKAGETIEDWDGICGELADKVMGAGDDVLYVEGEIGWRYHMVPLIDGFVHDAWCPGDAIPPKAWLAKMFGDSSVEVSLNGDTVYTGLVSNFTDKLVLNPDKNHD